MKATLQPDRRKSFQARECRPLLTKTVAFIDSDTTVSRGASTISEAAMTFRRYAEDGALLILSATVQKYNDTPATRTQENAISC